MSMASEALEDMQDKINAMQAAMQQAAKLIDRAACQYPNMQKCLTHPIRDPLLEARAKLQPFLKS